MVIGRMQFLVGYWTEINSSLGILQHGSKLSQREQMRGPKRVTSRQKSEFLSQSWKWHPSLMCLFARSKSLGAAHTQREVITQGACEYQEEDSLLWHSWSTKISNGHIGKFMEENKTQHTENKMDSLTLTRAIQIETTILHFPPIWLSKHKLWDPAGWISISDSPLTNCVTMGIYLIFLALIYSSVNRGW